VNGALTRGALASAFARSFLIQGSWNYHTMIGSGFAFALLPGLRRIFRKDPARMDESVRRHLELFNAHPYLSNVALGAVLRLEADGADADTVRRFKAAVRGPLGSLGDSLVWATWLPAISAAALALYWLGLPTWVVVGFFLVVYNLGHVGLRAWGFRAGLEQGREVGRVLGRADLSGWATRLQGLAVALLGVLAGAVLGGTGGLADAGSLWVGLGAAGFLAGQLAGHRVWRPAAIAVVVAIVLVSATGVLQ
jgi:PTS system mannose-specific IID component